jgi:DNA-binding transcriptional ArsR family regulator
MMKAGWKPEQTGRIFQALADPTRREMVERLSQGPVTVSELARPFAMTLAAVLQHVQVLEQSELVKTEKQGRVRLVRLNPEGIAALQAWVADRNGAWERRLDRLGSLVEDKREN